MTNKSVFSYSGIVDDRIFYSIPNFTNVLFTINLSSNEIVFRKIPSNETEKKHLLQTSLTTYKGRIIGSPGRGNDIFIYDNDNGTFELYQVTDERMEYQLEQYSSSIVVKHILYVFPLLAKRIIRFDLERNTLLNPVSVSLSDTDYYYARNSFAHDNRIIVNNVFPDKIGGFFTVYNCENGSLDVVSETLPYLDKGGSSVIYDNRVLSLCVNGQLVVFDLEKLSVLSQKSGKSEDDHGFRNLYIKDGIAYCFSFKTGTVEAVDIGSMTSVSIPTEFDGFYGVYRIDEDSFIASTLGTEYAIIRVNGDKLVTEMKYDLNDSIEYRAIEYAENSGMRIEDEQSGLDVMIEAMKCGYV